MARQAALYPGWRCALRYRLTRWAILLATRILFRVRVEGPERFPGCPAIVCFNHLNWIDPFIMLTVLPPRPRIHFLGPREADMHVGFRNRLMTFSATAVPFKPGNHDLLDTTRRVGVALGSGGILAIAGEGRIQPDEHQVLEIQEGTAYFALRNRVPIVPVAINGTSHLAFRRTVRVRVGMSIEPDPRPSREAVATLSARVRSALLELVADAPVPRAQGGWADRLTELFNDWPEGSRTAAEAAAVDRRSGGTPGSSGRSLDAVRRPGATAPPRAGQALWHTSGAVGRREATVTRGASVGATGLSADPGEYRGRLAEQSDEQLDAWAAELMRDVAKRRGVAKVVADFLAATRISDTEFERVFASGGGAPATIGRDAAGRLIVPTISLHALVPGIRQQAADARERLIAYLVANFGELVYV